MWKCIVLSCYSVFGFGQSPIQISTERLFKCDIFSEQQNDSSYCNYYITDFTDTVYFKHDQCLFTVILTSPTTTFKRKTQNGYAEGTLKIYTRYEGHYSVEEGSFSDGIAIRTHYREYYDDGTYKTAGQYLYGQADGPWIRCYENGQIERIAIFENWEALKEREFDLQNNVLFEYDLIRELNNPETE